MKNKIGYKVRELRGTGQLRAVTRSSLVIFFPHVGRLVRRVKKQPPPNRRKTAQRRCIRGRMCSDKGREVAREKTKGRLKIEVAIDENSQSPCDGWRNRLAREHARGRRGGARCDAGFFSPSPERKGPRPSRILIHQTFQFRRGWYRDELCPSKRRS